MPSETLSHYLNEKRVQNGLTYEAVANISNIPESTVKNLCTGKTKNPAFSRGIFKLKQIIRRNLLHRSPWNLLLLQKFQELRRKRFRPLCFPFPFPVPYIPAEFRHNRNTGSS